VAAIALGAIVLFLACLRIASGEQVNSDAAGNALEAWAMLHGNWLLRGWTLTDVSFYTTELPQYALVEVVRGLRTDVPYICAALTYTLIVLLAALLARGRGRGREGIVAAAVAAAIILIPQPGAPTDLLMSTPDHTGTAVPVLITLLVIDFAPRRWWVPPLVALLLAWGVIADPLVQLVGAAPIVIVCGLRWVAAALRERKLLVARFEAALAVAAVVAVGIGSAVTHLIRAIGGWTLQPVVHQFTVASALPGNTAQTIEGVLGLFGADFFTERLGLHAIFTLFHLLGVALVVAGIWLALRHGLLTGDLIAALLAMAIVVNIAVYMVTYQMTAFNTTREIAPVLGLGAALAGRAMAGPLLRARLEPLVAAGLACYLVIGAVTVAQAPASPPPAPLVSWLEAHGLRTGLAGYWQTSSVVMESGGQIQMGLLGANRAGLLAPRAWESDMDWFDAGSHDATFVITIKGGRPPSYITEAEALRTFGPPAQTFHFEGLIILSYHRDLIPDLAAR
jgi:hypothetical protein